MCRNTCRFIHNNQIFIFIQNIRSDVRTAKPDACGFMKKKRDDIPPLHSVIYFGCFIINENTSGKFQAGDFMTGKSALRQNGPEHKTVFFDTRYELRDYEVVAAFYAKAYPKGEEEGFVYYQYKDLSSKEAFNEYVSNVKALSVYDTGITPVYGDELITMSTCNYHTEDGRFVVVARRIKDAPKSTEK